MNRDWVFNAIESIEADFQRSADTHMVRMDLAHSPKTPIYFKDESTHPSGSLKHRLARSLFLYGLCNGWIEEGTQIVEASSGSTAVSEAYFARLLGLPFTAVVPASTSKQKLMQIVQFGGKWHMAMPGEDICDVSRQIARQSGGHFMDQFTFAERATDWRSNNNIAQSLFRQLQREPEPVPATIVVGAGTGGTSATIGRYTRYHRLPSRLVVVDPEHSVFFDFYQTGDAKITSTSASMIEGIGRPFVVASFLRKIVDAMFKIPDVASLAAMLVLEERLGRSVGPSTGTNFIGVLNSLAFSKQDDPTFVPGPIVTLICDSGERYRDTYFDQTWREENGFFVEELRGRIEAFFETGEWDPIGMVCRLP